jgi:hypothetical protein
LGTSGTGCEQSGGIVQPRPAPVVSKKSKALSKSRCSELDAFIRDFVSRAKPNLYEILALSPQEKAYLAQTREFQILILSLAVDCVVDGDRMTRAQLRVLDWFKSNGPVPKPIQGEKLEVSDGGDED